MHTYPVTQFSSSSASTYILDNVTTQPVWAYSMRLLRSAYSGNPCLRVRRSNDNAEQDVGFDSNGYLDTASMTSFTGANNGFVTTWYNQMGNEHMTQTVAGSQPQIVNAGSTYTLTQNSQTKAAMKMIASSSSCLTFQAVGSNTMSAFSSVYAYVNSSPGSVPVIGSIQAYKRIGTHYSVYYTVYADGNDLCYGYTTRVNGTNRTLTYNTTSSYDTNIAESRYGGGAYAFGNGTIIQINYTAVNGSYDSKWYQEVIFWGSSAPNSTDIGNMEDNLGSYGAGVGAGSRYYFGTP